MKTSLSVLGMLPLLVAVWISGYLFMEQFSPDWDFKTALSCGALVFSSALFILKVHLSDSRFG